MICQGGNLYIVATSTEGIVEMLIKVTQEWTLEEFQFGREGPAQMILEELVVKFLFGSQVSIRVFII